MEAQVFNAVEHSFDRAQERVTRAPEADKLASHTILLLREFQGDVGGGIKVVFWAS
jgi:hypothetical protein